MLAEFLLTPDAISGDDGRSGADVVRELSECLFPRRSTPLALVCKLGDEWERVASRKIARIANPNHRQDAMLLFQRLLSQHCVSRPPITLIGNDESAWIAAGTKSASHVPMKKIIVSRDSIPPANIGASVIDFVADPFWEDLTNPRLVGRDTAAQEDALRAICTHADWLILRFPQIRGSSDDEIVTVKQIVRLATSLPAGFTKSEIELQIPLGERLDVDRLLQSVIRELREVAISGISIKVAVLPMGAFVNREMLGGEYALDSTRQRQQRARWRITMNHVAVGGRRNFGRDDANSWCLYSRHDANARLQQLQAVAVLKSDSV